MNNQDNLYANIGSPSYGGEGLRTKWASLESGDNVYRILPPFKSAKNHWAIMHRVHWGYETTGGSKRPFLSPEVYDFDTKTTLVRDAAYDRIKSLSDLKVKAKADGDEETAAKAIELLKKFSLRKYWHLNVLDRDGAMAVLKIPHVAKLALDEEIKRLRAEGADPVGVKNGRYFIFRKSGEKLQTAYQVLTYQEQIEIAGHGKISKDVISDLSDTVIHRMNKEAKVLADLYAAPTAEQVRRMVTEGPSAVDEVFPAFSKTNTPGSLPTEQNQEDLAPAKNTLDAATLATPPAATLATPPAATLATPPAAKIETPKSTPVADPTLAQKNADFLKQMGF